MSAYYDIHEAVRLDIGDAVVVIVDPDWGSNFLRGRIVDVKPAVLYRFTYYVIEFCHFNKITRREFSRDKLRKLDIIEQLGTLA